MWTEISLYANDLQTGVLLKCRFDALNDAGVALDLKKTRDASLRGFSKSVAEYRYHVQAAFYSHVYNMYFGKQLQSFKFLAVEDDFPNFSKVWVLDDEALQIGHHEMQKDLKSYANAYNEDYWPLPCGGTETLSLPSWKISQYEEELEGEIK